MIHKPSIFITSLGRTGTLFFAKFFKEFLHQGTALHEPDIFTFSLAQGKGMKHVGNQIKESGFTNLCLKKALGKWSLIELSDARVRRQISDEDAVWRVYRQRRAFIESRPGQAYVESSSGSYALLDLLPRNFSNHRAAYIVRDGRNWIRSWMNWNRAGGIYNKGRLRSILAHNWPRASDLSDDPYYHLWPRMPLFEKLCWAWSRLNGFGISLARKNPHARVIRFEDVLGPNNKLNLKGFVDDITTLPQGPVKMKDFSGWEPAKAHQSKGNFPAWENWTKEQKEFFEKLCAPLMSDLGYDMK